MITLNIGWFILICVILFLFGFFTSGFMSGSKMHETDLENKKLKTLNNRQDMKIKLYESAKSDSESNNTKVTDVIKENQKRSKQ